MTGPCWTQVLIVVGAVVVTPPVVGPARAQEEVPGESVPEVGTRVRVTTDGTTEPMAGWIEARGGEGILLVRASDHAVVPISRDGIRRLEVSRVRRSGSKRSAPGMIAGGIAGLAIGVAVTEEHSCEPNSLFCFDFGSEKLMAGLLGATAGMLVGGLVSWAIVPAESWTEVPVASLRVAADPGGGGVALAVTLPWRGIP